MDIAAVTYPHPNHIHEFTFPEEWDSSIILVGEEAYKFLTCAGVTSARIGYGVYLSPADGWCWILMAASLIVTTVYVAFPMESENCPELYIRMLLSMIGALLERPIHRVPADILGIKPLLCIIWIFTCMILGTGWKATYTTDTITPTKLVSPFETFKNVLSFTLYSSVGMEQHPFYDDPSIGTPIPELFFVFRDLLNSNVNWITELARNALAQTTLDGFIHLKSLAYNHPAHFNGNLTRPSCTGKVYVDHVQNIEAILPYANRIGANRSIKFVAGTDKLVTSWTGWSWMIVFDMSQTRKLVEMQKMIVSSGIYSRWDALYKRFRPMKLFQHFDPDDDMDEGVEKTGLGSNILSAMTIFVVLSSFCTILFCCELTLKFSWRRCIYR
ncbi:hypothetical protein Fcan01_20457 [Folsomia candida]|uniref:Uncharacterized protein n=1 Tax=Folsomia candida TaxID=158441 RepID=A0A226DIL6_FOLCA|nr:hypothetical protein Fcan01_20457 [Folsomia candida]